MVARRRLRWRVDRARRVVHCLGAQPIAACRPRQPSRGLHGDVVHDCAGVVDANDRGDDASSHDQTRALARVSVASQAPTRDRCPVRGGQSPRVGLGWRSRHRGCGAGLRRSPSRRHSSRGRRMLACHSSSATPAKSLRRQPSAGGDRLEVVRGLRSFGGQGRHSLRGHMLGLDVTYGYRPSPCAGGRRDPRPRKRTGTWTEPRAAGRSGVRGAVPGRRCALFALPFGGLIRFAAALGVDSHKRSLAAVAVDELGPEALAPGRGKAVISTSENLFECPRGSRSRREIVLDEPLGAVVLADCGTLPPGRRAGDDVLGPARSISSQSASSALLAAAVPPWPSPSPLSEGRSGESNLSPRIAR